MTKQRLTDAIESGDPETKMWKSRFAAAKAAYAEANFKECETLLARALEEGKHLKEHKFAVNTCRMGQGALCLATDKLDEAEKLLDEAIRELSGDSDPALKELCGVAFRFHAEVNSEKGNLEGAEQDLDRACEMLETLGLDGAVQLAYAMGDLAAIYIKQGALTEAGEAITSSMEVLKMTLGAESPEYVRANVIHSLCHTSNEDEFFGGVEGAIEKMQYQRGRKHPSIVRAVRWYLQKLDERGEKTKMAEMEQKFGVLH
jgi:tetratricopeptide (TPR) repeat protein